MQTFALVMLVGILTGFVVSFQAPMASLISGRLGTLESVFIVHMGGAIAAAIPLLFLRGGNLSHWREVPPVTLFAGIMGLVVIGGISYIIPRTGATATIFVILIGQLIMSAIIDNYGWVGTDVRPFEMTRVLGVAVMFFGVWLMVR